MNQLEHSTCPLVGSEYLKYCALYPIYQEDNKLDHQCEYHYDCDQIKESLIRTFNCKKEIYCN